MSGATDLRATRRTYPPLSQLTREARDTLFLLAVVAWTLLPQWQHVPLWCSLGAMAALGWRAALAWRGGPLPGRGVLIAALALTVAATGWQYRTLINKEAGVTLMVVLMALKTLELRARRDAMVVFFLGFLAVLTNFLYSQSLALALAMMVSVLGLLSALALAHMPAGRPSLGQAARLTLRSMALGAPLVLLLFLFFPRLPPLWGIPTDAGGRTGLSDQLELGQVAELASDDALAMRVRFMGARPPPEALYFRGPVLRVYDGRRWVADDGGLGPFVDLGRPPGPPMALLLDRPVDYEMTIEPLRVATLPLLEITPLAPQVDGGELPLALRDDLHWQPHRPLTERWRLRATAYLDARAPPGKTAPIRTSETTLPSGSHPRTVTWAQALQAQPALRGAGPVQLADAVLAHIRNGGYTYTMTPGNAATPDAVDSFWLDRREGFCEHFASSFVIVMRAMGVPARIVTGYQGGQFNPVDGLLEVRQSDAHAWAEIWSRDGGWRRIDPTAAVAPDRIRLSARLTAPQGVVAGTLAQINPNALIHLRQLWGALDHRWNQWVLNYSRASQFDLLRQLGWQTPDLLSLTRMLLFGLGGLGLLGALWAAWDARRQRQADAWLRDYQRLQRQLAGRGLPCPAHLPPRALAALVRQRWGQAGNNLVALLLRLEAQRYGPSAGTAAAQTGSKVAPAQWRAALRALSAR